MNKTLHKKLTEKHTQHHTQAIVYANGDSMPTVFMHEMRILQEAAKDLLQPRPEAIAKLLKMAKGI